MEQLSFVDELAADRFYTISELTREVRYLLESQYPFVWVQGEVSNFLHHSSGHMYFSLKDEHAQISCVMWRSRNFSLLFKPRDGMKITASGRLTVFEKRGAYQLDILQMLPAGAGELQLAFEQLKRRLADEGLFADDQKKAIPRFPGRIGIVTSPTGAAIRDLITVLTRRFPGIEVILKPVRVQGEGAAAEIARAIRDFNEYGEIDVLIVGRGGGSLEDLWAFNEEVVARAIYASRIPVVSAVGHEIDYTISDFVADLRAPTPSAAAELVVPDRIEIERKLELMRQEMAGRLLDRVEGYRTRLRTIEGCYAFHQPLDLLKQSSQRLDELSGRMHRNLAHRLDLAKERLRRYGERLASLEHTRVLGRGYSICRDETGRIVTEAATLAKDDAIEIQLYRGKVKSTVRETVP